MILYLYILGYLSAVSTFPVQPNLSTQDDEAGHQSHFHTTETSVCWRFSELRRCVKVEVAVLGFPS